MSPNFTQCRDIFRQNEELFEQYRYTGPVQGIYKGLVPMPMLVTVEGCRAVCGTGAQFYSWQDASSTISTWILPLISLLLQAPYESNQFKATMFALGRWVGSPIASLSYILWNIDISGRCAIMVDNAISFGERPPEDSQYEQIRDSFYLLSVMNQYSVQEGMREAESEKLLRIVLFSDSLKLKRIDDESRSLVQRRRKLAKTTREFRKRSVVPIFVSLPWFLFSLVISIQAAFGQLGSNATAHNLALGLLMAWLPTLILFSIVDRNPVAAEAIRTKLNRLVDAVRDALLDPHLRGTYIRKIGRREDDFRWTAQLKDDIYLRGDFFHVFAGQGRARWHYGCGASILAGIEETYLVNIGRQWLDGEDKARTSLVKGPLQLKGLQWFDSRGLWCILSAVIYVSAAIYGAFIISYATPTVGLGCRSGGYMVFYVCALAGLVIEGITWWAVPKGRRPPSMTLPSSVDRRLSRARNNEFLWKLNRLRLRFSSWWHALTARDAVERLLLRPLEVDNAVWLLYCLVSQTFGLYQTCDCQSSTWGPGGSYMDFEDFDFYRNSGVGIYWGVAVALTNTVMVISFISAAVQWGQQSHLATEEYVSSLNGLLRTQRIRQRTQFLHRIPRRVARRLLTPLRKSLSLIGLMHPQTHRGRIQWCPAPSRNVPRTLVTPPGSASVQGHAQFVAHAYAHIDSSMEPPRAPPRAPPASHLPATPYVLADDDDNDNDGESVLSSAPMSREGSGESYMSSVAYHQRTTSAGSYMSPPPTFFQRQHHPRTASAGSWSALVSPRTSTNLLPVAHSYADDREGRRRSSSVNSYGSASSGGSRDTRPLLAVNDNPRSERGRSPSPSAASISRRAVHEHAAIELGLPPAARGHVRSPRGSITERAPEFLRRSLSRGRWPAEGEDAEAVGD